MNPARRARSQVHHEIVIQGSGSDHVLSHPFVEDRISPIIERDKKMNYDEQNQNLDATIIILGLGYASTLLVVISWVATL